MGYHLELPYLTHTRVVVTKQLTLLGPIITRIFPILLSIGLAWGQNESESIVLSGLWEWRYYYDNEDSNWVEYDIDVNRKFYYENIPFNF